MKKLVAFLLSLALCFSALITLTACNDNGGNTGGTSGGSDTTGDSTSGDSGNPDDPNEPGNESTYIVAGVSLPSNIVSFYSNSGEQSNKETEFFINSSVSEANVVYKVGDDNAFRFKPEVTYVNEELEPITAPADASFTATVKVEEEGAFVDGSDYVVFDEINATFDFSDTAIGKTFSLTVRPNGLSADKEADPDYAISMEVLVIDGYNAYDEAELAYVSNYSLMEENLADTTHDQYGWKAFREEKGLTLTDSEIISLKAIILHDNMNITASDVASTLFYTLEEVPSAVPAQNREYVVGSLKDDSSSGLYHRHLTAENPEFAFIGNYYTIDASKLPYVYYVDSNTEITFQETVNEETGDTEVTVSESNIISHASVFFVGDSTTPTEDVPSSFLFENVNAIGNSPKVENKAVQGGVILLKAHGPNGVMDNVISKCFFITAIVNVYSEVVLTNLKCYDAFNSPIYSWGAVSLEMDNCIVKNAGGPAIIVDAHNYDGIDFIPRVKATNVVLENYVTGLENWFVMAQASALVPAIQMIDAIPRGICTAINGMGMPVPTKTFLKKEAMDDGSALNWMNVYCVVKNDNDSLQERAAAYIEINGAVLDYGKGAKEGDLCNGADKATYRATLAGYINDYAREYVDTPVLESSKGGVFVYRSEELYPAIDPTKQASVVNALAFVDAEASAFNIYYHNGAFGTLGIMLEYMTEA